MLTEKSKISLDNRDSKYFVTLIISRLYKRVRLHLNDSAMIKKLILTIFLISGIGLISICLGQTVEYQSKCKEYRKIFKYRCAHLILKSDSTYHYEEMAVDIPIALESGRYSLKGDTLLLTTKNYGTLKYLKDKKSLVIYDPYNTIYITRKLTIIKSKNKAKA